MSEHTRQKIALMVFVVLVLLTLGGLIGYLSLGHSWNVAASTIDDATGQMDGYTAVLYEGTVEPKTTSSGNPDAGAQGSGTKTQDGYTEPEDSNSNPSDSANSTPFDSGNSTSTDSANSSNPSDSFSETGKNNLGIDSAGALTQKMPVTLSEVKESYLEKEATVFSLQTDNLPYYREGMILKKGSHRFGVFSVTRFDTPLTIQKKVTYFEEHEVDFIVVLTPDKDVLEKVKNVDIVISTQDENLFTMGETIDGTFYVSAPQVGSVGAILVSPHNVVSAKVIQEL